MNKSTDAAALVMLWCRRFGHPHLIASANGAQIAQLIMMCEREAQKRERERERESYWIKLRYV